MPYGGAPEKTPPLIVFQELVGLERLNSGVFFIIILMWSTIFASLFAGLFFVIWNFISIGVSSISDPASNWRWQYSLAKLAALTATLGAVVALPFTMVRLTYSKRQADVADNQLERTLEAQFNDKIDKAASELHTQRQITKWREKNSITGWEDDITRRNGAIDRLYGLVIENPNSVDRVTKILMVYVRELTREFPPASTPREASLESLKNWALELKLSRSDMQYAVQILGQMRQATKAALDTGQINLSRINLQNFQLPSVDFENVSFQGSNLLGASLPNSNLKGVNFDALEVSFANLKNSNLTGASFWKTKLIGSNLSGANLTNSALCFAKLSKANLNYATLNGADLDYADLAGIDLDGINVDSKTTFVNTRLLGAAIRMSDLSQSSLTQEQLAVMFGDATVNLPADKYRPENWSAERLDWSAFAKQWRAFQKAGGFDPDNPN